MLRKSPTDVIASENGTPVTVADRIARYLSTGAPKEEAAIAAGASRTLLYEWLRTGADASARLARAELAGLPVPDLTDHERGCMDLAEAVDRAMAEWELGQVALLEQLARGGIRVEKVVTKVDSQGKTLERTTTVETTLPDVRAIMWKLERARPTRWGPPALVVAGVDAGVGAAAPGAARALELAGQVRQYREAIEANASEAQAS